MSEPQPANQYSQEQTQASFGFLFNEINNLLKKYRVEGVEVVSLQFNRIDRLGSETSLPNSEIRALLDVESTSNFVSEVDENATDIELSENWAEWIGPAIEREISRAPQTCLCPQYNEKGELTSCTCPTVRPTS